MFTEEASAERGKEVVGSRIRVLFGGAGAAAEKWYDGTLRDYDETNKKHFITYVVAAIGIGIAIGDRG